MPQHNEDSFSASFESMSIDTKYSDSSNDVNVFTPYTMSYGHLLHIFQVPLVNME